MINKIVCWACKTKTRYTKINSKFFVFNCSKCKSWYNIDNDLLLTFQVRILINSYYYLIEGRHKSLTSILGYFNIYKVVDNELYLVMKLNQPPIFNTDNFRTEIERYLNNVCFQ